MEFKILVSCKCKTAYPVQNSSVRSDALSKSCQIEVITCPKLGSKPHLPLQNFSVRNDDPENKVGG